MKHITPLLNFKGAFKHALQQHDIRTRMGLNKPKEKKDGGEHDRPTHSEHSGQSEQR